MAKKKSKSKAKSKRKKKGGSLVVFIITVAVILLVITVSQLKRGTPVKFIKAEKLSEFGTAGDKKGQLNSPRGIAISPDNNYIYVTVLNNQMVDKFAQDGTFVAAWGGKGTKPGDFNEPSGISVDKEGFVWVADAWNGRMQKFDPKGNFKLEIGGVKSAFYSPRNVAVNKYGNVFVADTGTSRLHKYDTDGNKAGNPIGGQGKSPGKFNELFGIAFDSKGRVYVADAGNRRIQVFTSELQPVAQIKVKAWDDAFPLWPMIAVDSRDYLYVVSSGTQELIVFDTKDKKFKYVGTIKNDMRDKGLFNNPLGIAIDSLDNVYVTEIAKNKILKIKPVFDQQ